MCLNKLLIIIDVVYYLEYNINGKNYTKYIN